MSAPSKDSTPAPHYHYQVGEPLWPAAVMLAVAVGLAVLLPDADLRLLALTFAAPPLLWLLLQWRRRMGQLTLADEVLIIRHPFSLRKQRIRYEQVAGVITWTQMPRLGLAYWVKRPPFEGLDDPRPPRLLTTATAPLADLPAALTALQGQIRQHPSADPALERLDDTIIRQRLRARRLRRAIMGGLIFLATPLLVIVGARLLAGLRLLLPG